jgi:hypothetical protein
MNLLSVKYYICHFHKYANIVLFEFDCEYLDLKRMYVRKIVFTDLIVFRQLQTCKLINQAYVVVNHIIVPLDC